MIHLRIVAPGDRSTRALELLKANESVVNVAYFPGAVQQPQGDLILADVAREDASVVLSDLKELDLDDVGSIAVDDVQTVLSQYARDAVEHARGSPSDAVVWEAVAAVTEESTELSGSFAAFMVLAGLIAAVGIFLDSPILVIGAMVVGPEFGPVATVCIAIATKRLNMALRSAAALAVGFPAAILSVFAATLVFRVTGLTPDRFTQDSHALASVIANPDFFAFFVASCAAIAGVLSLSTAKSGALVGVLISVTTIPAAANIGLSAAYADWESFAGSAGQLGLNLAAIILAGTLTLTLQRMLYMRRRVRHLSNPRRRAGGLPVGHSQHED